MSLFCKQLQSQISHLTQLFFFYELIEHDITNYVYKNIQITNIALDRLFSFMSNRCLLLIHIILSSTFLSQMSDLNSLFVHGGGKNVEILNPEHRHFWNTYPPLLSWPRSQTTVVTNFPFERLFSFMK